MYGTQDIAAVALKFKLDGLIVGNTTITRPGGRQPCPPAPLCCTACALSTRGAPWHDFSQHNAFCCARSARTRRGPCMLKHLPPTPPTPAGAVASYPEAAEVGGLSGPPLMDLSTGVLADMYRLTGQGGCG